MNFKLLTSKISTGSVTKKNGNFIIFFLGLIIFFISLLKEFILPSKYFYDGNLIFNLINNNIDISYFDSFNNTAFIFSLFPFPEYSINILGSFFITISLYWSIRSKILNFYPINVLILYSIFSMIMSVYLTQPSKELICLFIIFSLFFFGKTVYGFYFWLIIVATYALFFRSYWFIYGVVVFLNFNLFYKQFSIKKFIFYNSIIIMAIVISYQLFYQVSISLIRDSINIDRLSSEDAVTIINNIIPNYDILSSWLNAILHSLLLFIPIPLAMLGGVIYTISSLLILSIFLLTFKSYYEICNKCNNSVLSRACFFSIISFPVVQGLFEPDYGSFIKHLSPMLPLILYIYMRSFKVATH